MELVWNSCNIHNAEFRDEKESPTLNTTLNMKRHHMVIPSDKMEIGLGKVPVTCHDSIEGHLSNMLIISMNSSLEFRSLSKYFVSHLKSPRQFFF